MSAMAAKLAPPTNFQSRARAFGSAWRMTRELSIRLAKRYTSSLGSERSLNSSLVSHVTDRGAASATLPAPMNWLKIFASVAIFVLFDPHYLPEQLKATASCTPGYVLLHYSISMARSLALREGAFSRTSSRLAALHASSGCGLCFCLANSWKLCFTFRSSRDMKVMTTNLPPARTSFGACFQQTVELIQLFVDYQPKSHEGSRSRMDWTCPRHGPFDHRR